MGIAETEKIKSILWKYIIMFILIVSFGGVMFKFVFLDKILGMGKVKETSTVEVSVKPDPGLVEAVASSNKFKIIGIVDGNYVAKTSSGLKKVKVDKSNLKRINDEIKIEKL